MSDRSLKRSSTEAHCRERIHSDSNESLRGKRDTKRHRSRSPISKSRGRSSSSDSSFSSSSDTSRSRSSSEERKRKKSEKKHSRKKREHRRKEERKEKKKKKTRKHSEGECKGPVQLSKFMEDSRSAQRSAISGKVMKMKVKKNKDDKLRDMNRKQLLEFLNASM